MNKPDHNAYDPRAQPQAVPPRWVRWLLTRLHPKDTLEEVEGDLDELYAHWYNRSGKTRATLRYVLNVVSVLPPFVRRRKQTKQDYEHLSSLHPAMLRNYLKIAFRNLARNSTYSLLNVAGLALGMTCGILLFTLITYHLSFDNFHPQSDRTYRFVTEQHRETISYSRGVPAPLGKAFRTDYTFADKVARLATFDDMLITVKQGQAMAKYKEPEGVAFAEPDFFGMFNYPLLNGTRATTLTEPNTAILTERLARKYFGDASPMNQLIRMNNKIDLRIVGVLKDLPINTDLRAEIFASYATLNQYDAWLASDDSWGGIVSSMQCFAQLRPGITPQQVERVLPAYVKKYRPTSKNVHHYKLQPLADMHFDARYGGAMTKTNLWVLACVGLFLLITACVNFVNLATAQALNRSKEVGVRKVLGSVRGQLFWQFITETGLITVTALLLSLLWATILLPVVNEWFGARLQLKLFSDWQLPLFLLALTVLVTLFSGAYPGLILSRFQPILALKGRLSQQAIGGFNTRRALIVTQFAISQTLIIGVIVIANQMRYAQQAELGFNKEAVVMVSLATNSKPQTQHTVANRFSALAGVKKVSLCQAAPASRSNWSTSPRYDNRPEDEPFAVNVRGGDDQFMSLFDLQLVAGRNVYPADSVREFVVNEAFVRKLNLTAPGAVLGKMLSLNGDRFKGPIVGVIRDFHDKSFHEHIEPMCISTVAENYDYYAVKIDLPMAQPTLAGLDAIWSQTHPDQVFAYQFLDEQIAEFYETETLMLTLIQAFAAIAIFIGCLGLYGLVSFMAAQKTKEIGIRKVLGSSTGQIIWIFAGEFTRLILIAFIVAMPVAWFAMSRWLQTFKDQISIGPDVFAFAMLGTFLVAILTVGYRSIKAALMNPVNSLRSE
ncbi:ABC transporter permease [Fibrella forsythiae]|uniref:ABC transporter permease n=1 Tax=Fibrella forsythiae TaxID=2817061 RepID=A0ABS3JEI5_9BACT|nr:ABC transporter permease [Fibrella forsythiae]MBO0948415.1 ABC transporter permease [Fibrella forsythiae]